MFPEFYWMSCIALVNTWKEFLQQDCPVENWDELLEKYGEDQAAAKFRLDTQLIRFREYCAFHEIMPIGLDWLQMYLPDIEACEACLEKCRDCLARLAPVVSLSRFH